LITTNSIVSGRRQGSCHTAAAPDPWSGSVSYFSVDRVKKLELSASEAINNVKRLGRGSQAFHKEI